MSDPVRTVDGLFGWANERFGLHIPRAEEVADRPCLAVFWNLALVDPPSEPVQLPVTVTLQGTWGVMTGLMLDDLSMTFSAS